VKLVIDSSIAKKVVFGNQPCRDCLLAIVDNKSSVVLICSAWAAEWLDLFRNPDYSDQRYMFLSEWKQNMLSQKRLLSVRQFDNTASMNDAALKNVCPRHTWGKIYLLRLAHEGDKVIFL
jgi:hypothetical protein